MKIFITDDDAMLRMIMADHLDEPGREFRDFDSGEELLMAIEERPDLILLDINMNGMDGVEVCKAWREQDPDHCQIMFISSQDDLETRLMAYDAGGHDYIVKPFEAAELKRKVKAAEAAIKHKKQLAEQAHMAGQTAFAALSTIGEMGIIQQFMRASFAASTAEQLAEAVLAALRQYDLSALIEIKSASLPGGGAAFSTNADELSQLEQSLLSHASGMGRMFQFSGRMVINYASITILINKLPMHDEDRVGRLRDHLLILAEGASMRLQAIDTEFEKAAQGREVADVLAEFVRTLETIQDAQAQNNKRARQIHETCLHRLINSFVSLGLTDKQEQGLIDISEQAQAELEELANMDNVSELLQNIADRIHDLLGQEDTMTFF